ncbi:CPBP family intramembrane metalloprotease [Halorussus gelatinilyticus]|uniref:CPBP family intramembrane metalloprotease n=1 Tax=Halorussus gelatinilyticus TaxID=2937524 RepID=A0A8U0ID55_9EURY|nr:type II CAAX endopeptidase family protein [Halorussus gelatinilyticus]UPV98986.1 CPBP family intramembrane metalloprotease [Halorussus gelatinilyticus]
MTQQSQRLRVFLRGSALAVGAFGIGQIVVFIAALAFQSVGIPAVTNPTMRVAVGVVFLQGVTFGGIALLYLRYGDRSVEFLRVRLPTVRDALVAVGGVVGLFALLATARVASSLLGVQTATNQVAEIGKESPEIFLLLVPLSYLLIGPGEELLYRGVIQGTFAEWFGTTRAIVLASSLFAVVHVFSLSGPGKLTYVVIVFGLALVLGALYEYTDNLLVPAFVHGTYNAVQFAVAYLLATGQVAA